ncbi:hypothetical protein B0H11DRAFT_2228265 [Mycena galericulata]|nr:hypothetical protein B0H11DRAFT_2228265 [Mycena galericulata]
MPAYSYIPYGQPCRRGRSNAEFVFASQVPGLPIRSAGRWFDYLNVQNDFDIWRKKNDPVYRGDVPPGAACAGYIGHLLDPCANQFSDSEEEDELTSTQAPLTRSSSLIATRPTTPEAGPSSPAERFSSPLTPVPPSRDVSPTLTDVANGWPPRLVTYSKPDRKRFLTERKARDAKAAAANAKAAAEKAKAAAQRRIKKDAVVSKRLARGGTSPSRRSARLRNNNGAKCAGIWDIEQAALMGHVVHDIDPDAMTPIINNKDYVIGVIAGPPKGESPLWVQVIKEATQAMTRLNRNGNFANLGYEESRVRFGVGFGSRARHATFADLAFIKNSDAFKIISAYQNHLVRQIAPKAYADLQNKISMLKGGYTHLSPAFPDSVFTTSEIAFGDGPQHSRKNPDAKYDTMEALTICGAYEWRTRGRIVFWDDDASIPLRPGTTLMFPAGTKRFSFVGVNPDETFCIFRQFCHAGVIRWFEKGCRSNADFEAQESEEKLAAFNAQRRRRAHTSIKSYSKINEVYVF